MNEKLIKIIQDNPDLDIVVMASTDEFTDKYGWILLERLKGEVVDIYRRPDFETLYFDKEEIIEELRSYLANNEEYVNMSDEEYDKMCEEKAKDYFYKRAIVIWGEN